jgi:hypothetical protein
MAFNKEEAEYNIIELKLNHQFALRMATIICASVTLSIIMLGAFFGAQTIATFVIVAIAAIILGAVSFGMTRSACL